MTNLFDPLTLRDTTFRNRAWVSPMCQYSATDGLANDWHFVHLGSRAVGGAGLVMSESTAVSPEGRITPADTGIWNEAQQLAWERVVSFMRAQGAMTGIQLGHAGRKASVHAPWDEPGPVPLTQGGWETVAPSAEPFTGYATPRAMTSEDIEKVKQDFVAAGERSLAAGFDVVEIHGAHGYLLHQFLSPLSNKRDDEYGGSFENRTRLLLEVTRAVRSLWPDGQPVFVRLSASDWVEGGWDLVQTVEVAKLLKEIGVDLIDCSSGGLVAEAAIPVGPGYQVPFAHAVKNQAGIPVAAVGLITTPEQAELVLEDGDGDAVFLARAALWDPYWPAHATHALGLKDEAWPVQYARSRPPLPVHPIHHK